jgi:hypothetical protein
LLQINCLNINCFSIIIITKDIVTDRNFEYLRDLSLVIAKSYKTIDRIFIPSIINDSVLQYVSHKECVINNYALYWYAGWIEWYSFVHIAWLSSWINSWYGLDLLFLAIKHSEHLNGTTYHHFFRHAHRSK